MYYSNYIIHDDDLDYQDAGLVLHICISLLKLEAGGKKYLENPTSQVVFEM